MEIDEFGCLLHVKKIKNFSDLPPYGKPVLVYGKDEKVYDAYSWHVCTMDDLEDGLDFRKNGHFYWLTESGRKITFVTHWCELPTLL